MKFNGFGKEIRIRKAFCILGLLILVILLTLWGGYLKTNQVKVFSAEDEPYPQEVRQQLVLEAEKNKEPEFININTDGIELLILLEGIGEVKARAIIEYRESQGPFTDIEQIKNVKGIGEATFQKIMKRITVEPVKPLSEQQAS